MTDVAAEIKDSVEVSKEVEKSDLKDEVVTKKSEPEKNGDSKEETPEKESETNGKSVENGDVKENGISEKDETTKESSDEVCGIKRKSEVGLESEEAPVESSEKKQKLEEPAESDVAANGQC